MKTATTLIGSVIMASVIIYDETGQSRPVPERNEETPSEDISSPGCLPRASSPVDRYYQRSEGRPRSRPDIEWWKSNPEE